MKRTVIWYAIALAVLIFLLKQLEYRYFIKDFSFEFYVGIVALLFTVLGVWAGIRLTKKKNSVVSRESMEGFKFNENGVRELGISAREMEVLQLIAQGFSNQEIADKLFISLNTVKTHSSNLFLKLEVKRRTQAIQKAKELALIP